MCACGLSREMLIVTITTMGVEWMFSGLSCRAGISHGKDEIISCGCAFHAI